MAYVPPPENMDSSAEATGWICTVLSRRYPAVATGAYSPISMEKLINVFEVYGPDERAEYVILPLLDLCCREKNLAIGVVEALDLVIVSILQSTSRHNTADKYQAEEGLKQTPKQKTSLFVIKVISQFLLGSGVGSVAIDIGGDADSIPKSFKMSVWKWKLLLWLVFSTATMVVLVFFDYASTIWDGTKPLLQRVFKPKGQRAK